MEAPLRISLPLALVALTSVPVALLADPLPSWNEGAAKDNIIAFVDSVTDPDSADFVPVKDRIATFDNDGTLWTEQPIYFQLLYAMEVLRRMAAEDPSVLSSDVLKAANDGDMAGVMAGGEEGLLEILDVSHANTTPEAFKASAYEWLTTAKHPGTGLPYAGMTFQPMLELLSYLRDEDFATYIVSGGGIDFIRAIADDAYGIPPWQVVGSEGRVSYEVIDGVPTFTKGGGMTFLDDKEGKPVGIMRHIGQKPIFAAGNSDGDFAMIDYTTAGEGPGFGLIVHHTDAEREYAYDREGFIGTLDRGLDEGPERGWTIVDMARDWARIYPGQ